MLLGVYGEDAGAVKVGITEGRCGRREIETEKWKIENDPKTHPHKTRMGHPSVRNGENVV